MVEKVPESREETPLTMERFRQEMRTLVAEELRKKAMWEAARERGKESEPYSADAVMIRPDDLIESDCAIWESIDRGKLSEEEYWEYAGKFQKEMAALAEEKRHPAVKRDIKASRDAFRAVVADRAQLIFERSFLERERQSLEAFREEMRALKAEEMRKKEEWEARERKGDAYNPHWDSIEPDDLGEYERQQWRAQQARGLTRKELGDYAKHLAAEYARLRSRDSFRQLLVNKASIQITRQELTAWEVERPPGEETK